MTGMRRNLLWLGVFGFVVCNRAVAPFRGTNPRNFPGNDDRHKTPVTVPGFPDDPCSRQRCRQNGPADGPRIK